MKNALVAIDVQKYFAVEKAADLPQKIVKHLESSKYDFVLFTKFRNDPGSNFHKILHWEQCTGPPATDIHPILVSYATPENTFEKTTYSAFKSEAFTSFLKTREIQELDLCGINIDGCVLATAFEAFDLGFNVKILEELSSVASFRDDYEQFAKTIIARMFKRKIPK
ncbi:MAG: isochorismatase family cysteine hydrolase [Patescibacteria group bacterium]